MKPTFIGIGVQKCASTWVHHILKDHPQAFVSDPKEINFFSSNYDRGFQWYERHFPVNQQRVAIGEISTSYFYDPSAPFRAHRYNPDFRVIVTLRDPVERAYSNHLHELRVGHYHGSDLSFEAGLSNNPMYVEQSRYASHIKAWLDLFPGERMLVLLQEEVWVAPVDQARRVYQFLGIDVRHQSEFLHKRANESHRPRVQWIDSLFKGLGRLAQEAGIEGLATKAKKNGLVSSIRQANALELRQVIPPMQPQTRSHLQAELSEEVLKLAALLDREHLPWATWEVARYAHIINK